MLESTLPTVVGGGLRADLLTLLSELVKDDADGGRRERQLLEAAIVYAADDPDRHARALLKLEMLERHAERFLVALPMAREALALAETTDDESLLTEALTRTADLEVLTGTGGEPIARFARAVELDTRLHVDPADGPVSMLAVCLVRAGRLAEARPMLLRQRQRTLDEGDESSRDLICLFLAELEWLAGNWHVALEHAQEGLEVTEQTGSEVTHAALAVPLALVSGARGELDAAIRMVSAAAAQSDAIDERSYATYNRHAQGFLELTRGKAELPRACWPATGARHRRNQADRLCR